MKNISSLIHQELFSVLNHPISVFDGILTAIILVATAFCHFLLKKIVLNQIQKGKIQPELGKKIQNALLILLWIISFGLLLESVGIPMKEFMKYQFLKISSVRVTPNHLLIIVIIYLVTKFSLVGIKSIVDSRVESKVLDVGIGAAIFQIFKYILWIVAISLALESIGIQVTLILAGAGALLIGLGFGIQHIFNDVISGIILLIERNLKVDDIVEIGDIVGRVGQIGFRSSRIVTMDNIEILVPNSKFINDNVINWSHSEDKLRFCIDIGVAYGSDVLLVEIVLIDCAKSHNKVLKDPSPFVTFEEYGDSSLNFKLFFWTDDSFNHIRIKSDIRFSIYKNFEKHNIQIPFPQRDLHIVSDKTKGNISAPPGFNTG